MAKRKKPRLLVPREWVGLPILFRSEYRFPEGTPTLIIYEEGDDARVILALDKDGRLLGIKVLPGLSPQKGATALSKLFRPNPLR